MSDAVTLDSLRQEASTRFQDLPVALSDGAEVRLQSPLRLSTERREKLGSIQGSISDAEKANDFNALFQSVENFLLLVCDDQKKAKKLVADLGGDLAVTMVLLNKYMETAQLGEA